MNPGSYRMKWWGWGSESIRYNIEENPGIARYLLDKFNIKKIRGQPEFRIENINIPDSRLDSLLLGEFINELGASICSTKPIDRLHHSCGQSYPDIVKKRSMNIDNAPDAVFYPKSEGDIRTIIRLAEKHKMALIPFGGGTSVVGGVEPQDNGLGLTGTVNMTYMNKILEIDTISCTANIQAGIFGPELEAGLNKKGFTLGHFPQSFEFSTLGGWIAPRSSGQNSLLYGGIEKLVVSVKMLSPTGEINTHTSPRRADGPDLKELVLGSEGVLGIIVSAVLRIVPLPEEKKYFLYAFRGFDEAAAASRKIVQSGIRPAMIRASDEDETEAFITMAKGKESGIAVYIKAGIAKILLESKGIQPPNISFVLIGLEGTRADNQINRRKIDTLLKDFNCANLGLSPGKRWLKERFLLPYLREELLNNNLLVDTLETAGEWSKLMNLYREVKKAMESVSNAERLPISVMTHISHLYPDGASLYFTFITPQRKTDLIAQWEELKEAANEAIRTNGGAVSHHHGIGSYHKRYLPWNETERNLVKQLKSTLDPHGVMNPGKLL